MKCNPRCVQKAFVPKHAHFPTGITLLGRSGRGRSAGSGIPSPEAGSPVFAKCFPTVAGYRFRLPLSGSASGEFPQGS